MSQPQFSEAELFQFLPEDVIPGILLRLPVKSIGQLRCVSKSWRSLLMSTTFIKEHLNLPMNGPKDIFITARSSEYSSSRHILTLTTRSSRDGRNDDGILNSVNCTYRRNSILGVSSCHGLLLFIDPSENYFMVLMNPITLERVEIPYVPFWTISGFCLGYDTSKDDYKIVSLCYDTSGRFVRMYSVKEKSWRRIGDILYRIYTYYGVFINGCLHWITYEGESGCITRFVIIAFGIAGEKIEEVPFPHVVGCDFRLYSDRLEMGCLKGCLALVHHHRSQVSIDVWMMRDCGMRDSWTKLTIKCDPEQVKCDRKVVCMLGEDEIVLKKYHCSNLVAYNLRNGVWRDLVVSGIDSCDMEKFIPFRESLVSPIYERN